MKNENIKTQADACKILNREPKEGEELKDIADAINFIDDEYKPKVTDWRPFFEVDNNGGFGFTSSLHDLWHTYANAGARLCFNFRTKENSDYFGKEFLHFHQKRYFS